MKALSVVVVLAATTTASYIRIYDPSAGRDGSWSYGEHDGPDTWPDSFPTCGGSRQSPVAVSRSEAVVNLNLGTLSFHNYDVDPAVAVLSNTGHSAQVSSMDVQASVSGSILTDEYIFHQFHFHWGATDTRGSEHTVDGVRFPAELHLVHYRQSYGSWEEAIHHADGVVVLGILLHESHSNNHHLHDIVSQLDQVTLPHETTYVFPSALQELLPHNVHSYFTYQGSLTTPTCNEIVTWIVFEHTIAISHHQLEQFRKLLTEDGNALQDNYRPLQPLNGRQVYYSSQVSRVHDHQYYYSF